MTNIRPIVQKLGHGRAQLLGVVEQVPDNRWQQRPTPQSWSVAEVIAHLTQVETAVVEGAERLIQTEPKPVRLWERLHIPPQFTLWRFPRARTPLPLDVSLVGEKHGMLESFEQVRQRLVAFLEANQGRELTRWRFRHPFFGSLHLVSWFRVLHWHELRHTKQLREIVESW